MSNTNLNSDANLTAILSQDLPGQTSTKECSRCGETLPLDQFRPHYKRGTPHSMCRRCESRAAIERKNKLSDAEYLWKNAQARAKQMGREFTISIEDVEVVDGDICPYLQIPMQRYKNLGKVSHQHQDSKTLDRIDSAKGYVPGNVIICSWKANRLLSDATAAEMALITLNFHRILNSTKPTE